MPEERAAEHTVDVLDGVGVNPIDREHPKRP